MSTIPGSKSSSMRLVWTLVVVAALVTLALAIAASVIHHRGTERLRAAEKLVRDRAEPLHAREIVFVGDDVSPQAIEASESLKKALDSAPSSDFVLDLDSEELALALAWESGRPAWPFIEEFVGLPRPESSNTSSSDFSTVLWKHIGDPRAPEELGRRERVAAEIERHLNEPLWPLARALCLSERHTYERAIRDLDPNHFVPDLPIFPFLESVRIPLRTLPALALEGRADELLARWMTAWRGVQRMRGVPVVIGDLAWKVATQLALDALQCVLPWLPPTLDLREVEVELRSIDVRAETLRAMIGERAIGNDVFDSLARSTDVELPLDRSGARYWVMRLWSSADRSFYLESMTDGIRRCGLAYPDAVAAKPDWERDRDLFPSTAIVSALMIPNLAGVVESQARLEATLRLASVTLVARRDGADAGRRAANALQDPFDGKTLRSRLDPQGMFVVWSVGPDGIDDGAAGAAVGEDPADARDLVWRVRVP